ncbi:hypothetical protein X546_18310 [Brevibacillus borstelensis cifa_chp40]|nr:hypothetical protein X546_18310 [Brevibacillus borstelensis cifa_chp40]
MSVPSTHASPNIATKKRGKTNSWVGYLRESKSDNAAISMSVKGPSQALIQKEKGRSREMRSDCGQ